MKLVLLILATCLLAFLVVCFSPWWMAFAVAGSIGFASKLRPRQAFLVGLAGIGMMWLIVAVYRDFLNQHILSQRMAALFSLPASVLYLVVTVVLGGLLGGLAAFSAAYLHRPGTR